MRKASRKVKQFGPQVSGWPSVEAGCTVSQRHVVCHFVHYDGDHRLPALPCDAARRHVTSAFFKRQVVVDDFRYLDLCLSVACYLRLRNEDERLLLDNIFGPCFAFALGLSANISNESIAFQRSKD